MIIINKDCSTFGKHDLSYWANYINAEFVDLSSDLCGVGEYDYELEKNKIKNPDNLEVKLKNVIRFLLCDCMLENYMKGFDKLISKDIMSDKELKEDNFFHDIIKLALVSTAEDIA